MATLVSCHWEAGWSVRLKAMFKYTLDETEFPQQYKREYMLAGVDVMGR